MQRLLATASLLLLVILSSFSQTTRRVPQDHATIQSAINAAMNGDTILVAEGTYFVNLRITKKIVLGSHYLVDRDTAHISRTILDGSSPVAPDSGSVILLMSGSDTSTVITGLTIRGGTGTLVMAGSQAWYAGGGIFCFNGSASIVRNVITHNSLGHVYSYGGGIATSDAAPYTVVRSNIIRSNRSSGESQGEGGGISYGSSGEISNNIVARNEVSCGPGGGMNIWGSYKTVKVINNTIVNNFAISGVEGVVLWTGAIYLLNNILWNPGDGAEASGFDASIYASNNLIRGDYYGESHFSEDPLFTDFVSYSLSSQSPAISAGTAQKNIGGLLLNAPANDVYGNPRSLPNGSLPDLGAVESSTSVSIPYSRDPQMMDRTMVVDGLTRRYIIFLPKDYHMMSNLSAMIFFHGSGGSCETYIHAGFNDIADREGSIVVYPDSYARPSRTWIFSSSVSTDMNFVNRLMDTLIAQFKVDPTRLFVAGKSNGGDMTFWFTSYYGSRVRAIAPIAMTMNKNITSIPKAIPMIYFHGTSDASVSYNGTSTRHSVEAGTALWASFNSCDSTPIFEYPADVVPGDYSTVVKISYIKQGQDVPPVQLYKIIGGGHSIPGPQSWGTRPINKDINAPELIWKFFNSFTDVEPASSEIPREFALSQNFPNPFNPSTTIRFSLPHESDVRITIFNLLGQKIEQLVNERLSAGVKQVVWEAKAPTGVYLCRLDVVGVDGERYSETRRMTLLK